NEDRFDVERCEGAGCIAFASVGTAAADTPSWSDNGVVAGRSYSYRVRAWASSGGYSGYSNVATATAGSTPAAPPAAPTNLSPTAVSSSSIRLQWTNGSSDQTGVSIERCKSPCRNFAEVARVAGNVASFVDSGLASRTSYAYRLRAYNVNGWSPYSTTVTARTLR
ncbi:MAG TPA: fibronectin type III domain-containing protein, partial [Burkholderiaceae bacterium]|nr:fibronectin type III domain-containing protein [Burkholderiaceae bacterium]